jgi:secreted PhoX family phosphatase
MKCLLLTLIFAVMGAAMASAGDLEFTACPFPSTDLEKRVVLTSQYASVDGEIVPLQFNTILRSGDKGIMTRHSEVFGVLVDENGDALIAEDGSDYISNSNDFSALVEGADGKLYMVSHFEDRPAAMYLTQLRQDKTGNLIPLRTRALDFSAVMGGWVHCAGSVTPWGNHLGSEEYEPDAYQWVTGAISGYNAAMAAYLGIDPTDTAAVQAGMNPYYYGFNVETTVSDYNNASVEKHYAMGRVAIELAYVMPDMKTAYISDDGTNVGLFRFEADTAGDLSAGTLYAAVYNETDTTGMGAATLTWVDLGHATDAEIRTIIDSGVTYTDIFEEVAPDFTAYPTNGCPADFSSINTTAGHQCLKVKDGMEKAASRLETRRYAAMLGATTEWRKMEGITYNPDQHVMYLAMSEVRKGMENDNGYDEGGPNHIKLATANKCGAVYALDLDANYDATSIYGLVAGIEDTSVAGNTCNIDGIANPDNITYIPGYDTLIIGEDTGSGHQNDVIWAYKTGGTDAGTLTRIQTTPYGSETTSPYFYPDINGFAYLMSVIQHPYGESDSDKLNDPSDARGYTGFIGPFPAMTNP